METFEFSVLSNDEGVRIDKFLSANLEGKTRSFIQKLIEDHGVLVGKNQVSKNYKLKLGDKVSVQIPDPVELDVNPENIPLNIVYQDDDLLVVDKPKGMVVHPAPGNYTGTLVNALMYHCKDNLSSINGIIRPGIVHRIDKNTSGLLMVAKNDKTHNFLANQIKEHTFKREYNAVCVGRFKEMTGTINVPIGRSKNDRKKMCVTYENSKEAVTHYEVLEEFDGYSLVKFILETGRTHQIRVHSKYIGHPVLGDDVYSKPFKGIEGQCLHAKTLGFIHPNGEYLEFESPLPEYFISVLKRIK